MTTRRAVLLGATTLAGGTTAVAVAGGIGVRRFASAQEFATDLEVLNYALTLEHLELSFYRDGLDRFTADDFDEGIFDNLGLIRDHEGAHVDALTTTITDLGGTPVDEGEYDFGYEDAAGFLQVAAALENTGVSAYDGAGAAIQDVNLLAMAGQIVAVEARHAAYLNLLNEEVPFPTSFEEPLARDEVLAIAGDFIVS